jgi:carbon-monoxide dehydrogenase small subunit
MSSGQITVNGREVPLDGVPPQETLREFVRSRAGSTGTAGACGHGVCGACTVLLDGRPARSCLTLSVAAAGRSVVTAEALEQAEPEVARSLREAFLAHNAFQCGYCTAGMLVLASWWVTASADERRSCPDVATLLESNLCRCTSYDGLREAIAAVEAEYVLQRSERQRELTP